MMARISIPRVITAIDCGTIVHPDRVRSQLEGAAVMGISTAVHGRMTFKQGQAEQSNFDTIELARMPEAPKQIETILVESDAPPAGVGEPDCRSSRRRSGMRSSRRPAAGCGRCRLGAR